jgi:serine phosphatase RsbU (regulator of sigma subunit)
MAVMAKVLIVDTFNHGPELGLLSQELRRLLATYGSEYDNSRLIGSFINGLSRMEDLIEDVRLTAATFDTRTGELIYAYRDKPDILMRPGDSSSWFRPEGGVGGESSRDIPVGRLDGFDYEQSVVPLSPNDWVLFYTRGLISHLEQENPEKGAKKFIDRLNQIDTDDPQNTTQSLLNSLDYLNSGEPTPDRDMMLLVLKAVP